jgi:hypothetical protein
MRKELAFLKKITAAKDIKDEDVLEWNFFIFARKGVRTGFQRPFQRDWVRIKAKGLKKKVHRIKNK